MKIEAYVQSEFERRLTKTHCLVIHDQEGRFRTMAHSLASASTTVVDAGESLVLAREQALDAWVRLADTPGSRLVVYVPWQRPRDDRGRRDNPFAPFALGGSVFPDGDADSYRELCLQCFPTQEEGVNRLFEDGVPSFEAVDGLAGGAVWPALRALLGVESEREMILALIAPSAALQTVLEAGGPWLEEARRLVKASLGHELPGLIWTGMQESLGRFLLFSEFALDLPGDLPGNLPLSLSEVPRAGEDRRSLVFALCESLRDSLSTRPLYRELAEKVDATLGLAEKFAKSGGFGRRGTFSFQSDAMLKLCIAMAKTGDFDGARRIFLGEESSVWYDSSAALRSIWTCAKAAVRLLDGLREFSFINDDRTTVADFIGLYAAKVSALDASYRDLEAFLADREVESANDDALSELVDLARTAYFTGAEGLQREFLHAVDKESWVGPASTDQAAIFRNRVAPRLDNHEKTAYFMIDALRLDLARELLASLPPTCRSSLDTVRGKLPSITPVGMAALLPGADSKLVVEIEGNAIAPRIGATRVANAQERVAYLKATYGDRVRDIPMADLEGLKKTEIGEQVDLLVIRSTEIDAAGECLGAEALPMLSLLLRNLLRALERTRKLGFPKAIIVTDHGFLLQPPGGAGGAIAKPDGAWDVAGARFLLGDGSETRSTKLFDASAAGVPGYSKKLATPSGLGSFVAGTRYVHGGLSLQECVLPVITIDFPSQAPKKREVSVALGYKGGLTKKVMTMRPAIDLSVSHPDGTDLFDGEHEGEVSIAILVRSGGKEVGRPQASAGYDPGSGCFKLRPGKAIKVSIAMNEDHRGRLTISALDPVTLEQYAKLELETDYTE